MIAGCAAWVKACGHARGLLVCATRTGIRWILRVSSPTMIHENLSQSIESLAARMIAIRDSL